MFDKYTGLAERMYSYGIDRAKLEMFDFGKYHINETDSGLSEPILTRSTPYYILIEYKVKEKIDILYGMEMNVTKRKELWLDLEIPSNAKAIDFMKIVNEEIFLATELTEFTILTINGL